MAADSYLKSNLKVGIILGEGRAGKVRRRQDRPFNMLPCPSTSVDSTWLACRQPCEYAPGPSARELARGLKMLERRGGGCR